MTREGNRHTDPRETDPEQLAKLLQIELMQKRAGWEQAKARRGTYRTMSFLFLFVVIVAAFVAFYLFSTSQRPSPPRGDARSTAYP